jgi:hypothetical protein
MKCVTITIPEDLEVALAAFRRDQPTPPPLAAIAQAALREYLAQRGYLAPKRALRITPAPHGSGESTVSIEHDRFLAQADE